MYQKVIFAIWFESESLIQNQVNFWHTIIPFLSTFLSFELIMCNICIICVTGCGLYLLHNIYAVVYIVTRMFLSNVLYCICIYSGDSKIWVDI